MKHIWGFELLISSSFFALYLCDCVDCAKLPNRRIITDLACTRSFTHTDDFCFALLGGVNSFDFAVIGIFFKKWQTRLTTCQPSPDAMQWAQSIKHQNLIIKYSPFNIHHLNETSRTYFEESRKYFILS